MLNHKNIVTLFAMIFERGHYGVVLEFVPDGCLEDFIHKHQVLNYITSIHMCSMYVYYSVSTVSPVCYPTHKSSVISTLLLNSASCALAVCV